MEHFPYLFAAYTIVWVVLFLYVLSLDRRARRAERELEEMKHLLEKRRD
ncbi:MAG TPA: CcmD family protein [Candidatus Binatia bacterium]|nr:CcmD family protein [Candidatus Binatia bacterium]